MKEFEDENEQEEKNDDQHRNDSFALNHSETASQPEIEGLFERSLQKIHEWHDMSVAYVYFKEKILGKKGKTGKKNIYQWIETNDVYYGIPETIKTDRDYWISAAETATQITKGETPMLREKWVVSVRCHFMILSLEEASSMLDFTLTCEQLKELVLEHCRQRGLPTPIIWTDGEELTLVWALEKPYYRVKENYYYDRKRDMWCEDEYTFSLAWDKVQNWLYEDLKYLGAKANKKHILTMLRVPGTLNTHNNEPVRILQDGEKISLSELKEGLQYVSERLERYERIAPPDLSKLLHEYEEFAKFCEELDKTIAEGEPKQKARKEKVRASKEKKPKRTRKETALSEEVIAEARENLGRLTNRTESLSIPNDRQKEYDDFIDQLRKDVLRIHPASDKYVCLCLKKKTKWQQLWVQAKDLERKLTDLWLRPDFSSYDIFDSQAEYLIEGNREVSKVNSIGLSFIDIDWKDAKGYEDLSLEDWVKLIISYCKAKRIPIPTIMVFSGNGIHLKWLYKEAISGAKLKLWGRLEKKLHKLFAELGADIKSTDLARVLRVPGTKNCKPETIDRDVRVVNLTSETYEFEAFLALIDDLVSDEVYEISPEAETESLDVAINNVEEADDTPAFYVLNETTGTLERVKKYEMGDYLRRQDKTHVLRCSIAEFVGNDLKTAYPRSIYCNYVKLSACKVPGSTFEEKAEAIRKRCHDYWGGGIPEANEIRESGDSLIVLWKYELTDKLTKRVFSWWKRVEEYLCEIFADWGAKDDSEYQEVTGLLPIAGFTGDVNGISRTNTSYTYYEFARKVLPFTPEQSAEYKAQKAEDKAKKDAERPLKRKRVFQGQKAGNFDRMSDRRFGDIWHLGSLRKDERGEVEQGHRELSVFWGMNFAVQSGRVTNLAEFDELTQKLIDHNGLQFRSECSVRTLTTLRGKFARGEDVYNAKTATLIEDLGISLIEQEELEVLREFPKREKKTTQPKAPSLESLKLWEVEGVSRRTWYYRRRKEREAKTRWEQVRRQFIAIAIERIVNELYAKKVYVCTADFYIMRGIVCVCVCNCIGGIGGRGNVRLCESVFGDVGKTIAAIVGKRRLEYTALKADKAVSSRECGKQRTPPPFPSNRLQRNVKKVA